MSEPSEERPLGRDQVLSILATAEGEDGWMGGREILALLRELLPEREDVYRNLGPILDRLQLIDGCIEAEWRLDGDGSLAYVIYRLSELGRAELILMVEIELPGNRSRPSELSA
jgi:DNA-binding PadR family transcriptional regulator